MLSKKQACTLTARWEIPIRHDGCVWTGCGRRCAGGYHARRGGQRQLTQGLGLEGCDSGDSEAAATGWFCARDRYRMAETALLAR